MDAIDVLRFIGGVAFGAVLGWITYFVMRRAQPKVLSDLSTILGTLGGGVIVGLFDPETATFAGYAIGLAVGFFGYYLAFLKIVGRHAIREVMLHQGSAALGGAPLGGISKPAAMPEAIDWGPEVRSKRTDNATPGQQADVHG